LWYYHLVETTNAENADDARAKERAYFAIGWSDRGNEWSRPGVPNDHLMITDKTACWLHYRWGSGPGVPDEVLGKGFNFASLELYLTSLK
jgi:hypothetical protein